MRAVVAASLSEEEFFARLADDGVLVKLRPSQTNPDELTGYSVGLPAERDKAGVPVWFGASRLAADLSLPKLRIRWGTATPTRQGGERPAEAVAPRYFAIYLHHAVGLGGPGLPAGHGPDLPASFRDRLARDSDLLVYVLFTLVIAAVAVFHPNPIVASRATKVLAMLLAAFRDVARSIRRWWRGGP